MVLIILTLLLSPGGLILVKSALRIELVGVEDTLAYAVLVDLEIGVDNAASIGFQSEPFLILCFIFVHRGFILIFGRCFLAVKQHMSLDLACMLAQSVGALLHGTRLSLPGWGPWRLVVLDVNRVGEPGRRQRGPSHHCGGHGILLVVVSSKELQI